MATYYVSPSGSNANNGLGPDASHASNKPWLTVDYAMSTATSAGDIVYIGPGTYRETCVADASGSAGSPIQFLGDPLNLQGFKTSGGALLSVAPVVITAFTSGDTSEAANVDTIGLGSRGYLTLENLWIIGGKLQAVDSAVGLNNIVIRKCHIFAQTNEALAIKVNAAANILIDRCIIVGNYIPVTFYADGSATAEYDCGITLQTCLIVSLSTSNGVLFSRGTASTYLPAGGYIKDCTILAGQIAVTTANWSVTTGVSVRGCYVQATTALSANAEGAIVENYNYLAGRTARSNISGANAGANTVTQAFRSPCLDFGQSEMWGFGRKTFAAPWAFSSLLSFATDSSEVSDLFNRLKPSGSGVVMGGVGKAVGAIECHDYGTADTAVKDAGDASIRLKGPGDHELLIPVDASATTISIKVQYDNAGDNDYGLGGGSDQFPQAILLDNEGFANISGNTETETATTDAAGAWQTLTFTAFTPSRKGVVRLRLVSRDTNGDGYCYFDTLAVS